MIRTAYFCLKANFWFHSLCSHPFIASDVRLHVTIYEMLRLLPASYNHIYKYTHSENPKEQELWNHFPPIPPTRHMIQNQPTK